MPGAERLDVAILGAGTAGLAARAEVAKRTDSYRVFDPGPLGTLCARTACMPSKAFLQSAHDFHRRHAFAGLGIDGAEGLSADPARVLAETRALRDDMVAGVIGGMAEWRAGHLVPHAARFEPDGTLVAGGQRFRPRASVIATGSRPVVPPGWRERFGDRILTSDDIFERQALPRRIAVMGLGPVGLELGQGLARLGLDVTGFDPGPTLGGLADPGLMPRLRDAIGAEMRLVPAEAEPEPGPEGAILMRWSGGTVEVDAVLVAMGRAPNLEGLGLDALGVRLEAGRVAGLGRGRLNPEGTRAYFAGDAGAGPALLHEAADAGRVAGHFAARAEDAVFERRVPLSIVFSEPQVALAGAGWDEIAAREGGIAIGTAAFDGAGRTRLQRAAGGAVRIYAARADGRLLGAALLGPEVEHPAHLLAHAIGRGDGVEDILRMPVYHPTHEEVLRRALRDARRSCQARPGALDAIRCEDAAAS